MVLSEGSFMRKVKSLFISFCLIVNLTLWTSSHSVAKLSLIRDAEIESVLKEFSKPIFKAAGLDPNSVSIYIINHPSLNAFVMGGQNIFIHTGTLAEAKSFSEMIAIIAHETGHIAGGHLAIKSQIKENLSAEAILSLVLGVAVGIASGDGAAGAAVTSAGQNYIQKQYFAHSRAHEGSADQAAIRYLKKAGYSPEGLLKLFKTLKKHTPISINDYDPYLLTHPLPDERISLVERHVSEAANQQFKSDELFEKKYQRIRSKAIGFLYSSSRVKEEFPNNESFNAQQAEFINQYRSGNIDEALNILNSLQKKYPNDGYLHELKGQILFENGYIEKAVLAYKKALQKLPQQALIKIALAHALLETNDSKHYDYVIKLLDQAQKNERKNSELWRLKSIAYGKSGKLGLAALALAEKAFVNGQYEEAKQQALRAKSNFKPGAKAILRANDIIQQVNNNL